MKIINNLKWEVTTPHGIISLSDSDSQNLRGWKKMAWQAENISRGYGSGGWIRSYGKLEKGRSGGGTQMSTQSRPSGSKAWKGSGPPPAPGSRSGVGILLDGKTVNCYDRKQNKKITHHTPLFVWIFVKWNSAEDQTAKKKHNMYFGPQLKPAIKKVG